MTDKTIWFYLGLIFTVRLGTSLIFAVYLIYLLSRGLDLFQASMVAFCFYLASLFCEIPAGLFADRFGRKKAVTIACFLEALGFLTYAFAESFWQLASAEMIFAAGVSFLYCPLKAWLVDELKQAQRHHDIGKTFVRGQQFMFLSPVIGAPIGAYLAKTGFLFPWLAGGSIFILSGLGVLLFMEENRSSRQAQTLFREISDSIGNIKTGIKYGWKTNAFRFLFLTLLFQSFTIQAPNMFWQKLYGQALPGIEYLGGLFVLLCLAIAIGAEVGPRADKASGNTKRSLALIQVCLGIGIILAGAIQYFWLSLGFFMFHEMCRGAFMPLHDGYLNENIPSSQRATLISIESTSNHVGGMAGLLLSGFFAEIFSIPAAWILSGGFIIFATLLLARNCQKKHC